MYVCIHGVQDSIVCSQASQDWQRTEGYWKSLLICHQGGLSTKFGGCWLQMVRYYILLSFPSGSCSGWPEFPTGQL